MPASSWRATRLAACHTLLMTLLMLCMQALRLFVHYPFLVRAAHHCRASGAQQASDESGDWLANEALKTCLRGQTFFSVGLRGLYAFIPLVGLRVEAQSKLLYLRWPPAA